MTDYKLLKIMKKISRIKKDEIKISEIMKLVKLNNNDLYILVNELLDNGYIEKSKSIFYIDSFDQIQDYRITNKGENFLKQQSKLNNRYIFIEFRNWMTLFIALAAFIKSFYF